MYCASSDVATGWGPRGLAAGARPLPLRTRTFSPEASKATPVGYQPVGMKPSGRLSPGPAHVHHRDRVVVGVRDEEGPAVGREGQGVGGAAQRRVGPQGHADLLDRLPGGEIDDPHRVRVGAGHEEAGPVAGEDHRVRVLADHDLAERPQGDAARRGPPGTRPTPRRRRSGRRATRASRTPRPAASARASTRPVSTSTAASDSP